MAGGLNLPPQSAATNNYEPTQQDLNQFMQQNDFSDMFDADGGERYVQAEMDSEFGEIGEFNFDSALEADDVMGSAYPQYPALTPSQTPMDMQIPMQAPMAMEVPAQMPDMSIGPSWNPMIGWYYPVAAPAAMPPPPPPAMPFATPSEGYTPASTTPLTSAMPSRTGTPDPASHPFGPKARAPRKRKYGPAAYLEQQAKTSDPAPRVVSVSEAEYTSMAKARDERAAGVASGKKGGQGQRRKQFSVVQVCICTDKQATKIKRPKNAFILYRSANAHKIMRALDTKNNQNVSTEAARAWKAETPEVKERYAAMAQQEKQRHLEKYPDYQYQPGLAARNKFGSMSCTCGAYQINCAANKAKLEMETGEQGTADFDAEFEPEELYVPPRSFRPAPKRQPAQPAAPMTVS
ncbi:slightly ste11-like protein [Vermiconidia calcicola]|uniref:Slightly ste11-like protein n=1 Tax=Vermiconidia calcicola TaxID=1690605 RepID=A0ACC3NHQ9_9PEZI|nr:slightly ste11-like protein [Vermiconidia calcicola]